MGWEPTTYCTVCNEPFDVYRAEDERICECCQEDISCLDLEDQLDTLLDAADRACIQGIAPKETTP